MLLLPNLCLLVVSFICCDYGDLFIRPVRTIEKISTWLERETPFICSAVKSSRKVLKLVRQLINFVNIDATL